MLRLLTRIRIPDVAFISFDRLPGRTMPTSPIPAIAPDLIVEVISDSNTRAEMDNKLREYFAAGTRLVWYVDPPTRTVDVYTSPQNPQRLTVTDTLSGGDVLPGFQLTVAAIFDVQS
jgi:Uma2 family endonuclease